MGTRGDFSTYILHLLMGWVAQIDCFMNWPPNWYCISNRLRRYKTIALRDWSYGVPCGLLVRLTWLPDLPACWWHEIGSSQTLLLSTRILHRTLRVYRQIFSAAEMWWKIKSSETIIGLIQNSNCITLSLMFTRSTFFIKLHRLAFTIDNFLEKSNCNRSETTTSFTDFEFT
jgi:hypothetical protein